MAHPLKGFARAVQETLEADDTLARPTYMWCLAMVEKHIATARQGAMNRKDVIDKLIDAIRPLARKPG